MSLITYPHNISAAIESELAYNSSLGNGTLFLDYASVESRALYWEANITGLTDSSSLSGTLNFTFSSSATGEYLSGGTFIRSGDLWLDRAHSSAWTNPFFTDKFSVTSLYSGLGSWRVTGIIDRSIIEVFLNGGEYTGTSVFFPTEPFDRMTLAVKGINESASASVGVWSLKATWLDQADANGTVVGNVTESNNSTEAMRMAKLF
jgi:beta-fructofuranosidase